MRKLLCEAKRKIKKNSLTYKKTQLIFNRIIALGLLGLRVSILGMVCSRYCHKTSSGRVRGTILNPEIVVQK